MLELSFGKNDVALVNRARLSLRSATHQRKINLVLVEERRIWHTRLSELLSLFIYLELSRIFRAHCGIRVVVPSSSALLALNSLLIRIIYLLYIFPIHSSHHSLIIILKSFHADPTTAFIITLRVTTDCPETRGRSPAPPRRHYDPNHLLLFGFLVFHVVENDCGRLQGLGLRGGGEGRVGVDSVFERCVICLFCKSVIKKTQTLLSCRIKFDNVLGLLKEILIEHFFE